MVFGYLLISTKNSYEHQVAEKLSMLDEIVDVEPLIVEETAMADPFIKDYDLIAKIRLDDFKDFNKFLAGKVHNIFGVEKTKVVSKTKK